jgi:hypothetical protein
MVEFPLKIPLKELGGFSPLFTDYVSKNDGLLQEILGGFGREAGAWAKRTKSPGIPPPGSDKARGFVFEALMEYNAGLGAGGELLGKIRAAKDGKARFVVTGQQPGVLGGPLLTLHKIATAIALSVEIEKRHGLPCVPLFWMGADDSDFQEIREFYALSAELLSVETGIESGAYEAATPVGDIAANAVTDVFTSVGPLFEALPGGEEVKQIYFSAQEGASDHGELTARLISRLTGGRIAVVDGREPQVRECARDLFCAYFDHEEKIKAEVARQGGRLEAGGFHRQLFLGPDSGVFFLEGGRRRKIAAEGREAARLKMKDSVADFSPGVVLRNLVQDFVFDPVAVVLGPAEIAYRAQTAGVHDMLSVPRPVVFPRMTATYLPPPLEALVKEKTRSDVITLLTRPSVFARAVYTSASSREVESAAESLRDVFGRSSEDFLKTIEKEVDSRRHGKLSKGLYDVRRRLDRVIDTARGTGKAKALVEWPWCRTFTPVTGPSIRS